MKPLDIKDLLFLSTNVAVKAASGTVFALITLGNPGKKTGLKNEKQMISIIYMRLMALKGGFKARTNAANSSQIRKNAGVSR